MEIIYSQAAKDTSRDVYAFIKEKFGDKAARDFLFKINKTLRSIGQFPEMFKASQLGENIRIGLITKQSSVLYEVLEDAIFLHYFWDNRQEPMIL
ncbi:type II toxin-antitoxin system RelE/ParE family toxin [Pedobacter sp. PWIIR3]